MAKHFRRQAAFLTAAVLLSAGTMQVMPAKQGLTADTGSVLPFAQKLLRQPHDAAAQAQFTSLRFAPEQAQIYRDGDAVGSEFGKFCIADGQPMISRALTETAAERAVSRTRGSSAEAYVPLSEAAEKIGCMISEENGEITVESPFRSGTLLVQAKRDFDTRGAVSVTDGYRDLHVLQYETAADAYAAYLAMQNDAAILSVEPNRTLHAAESENGFIEVNDRWGVDAIGADSYRTWLLSEKQTLPEIKVAVIDTGIYEHHSWFRGRIAEGGAGFTYSEGGSYADGHSHGTHCAGIICMSTTDNVKILPLKSLADDGYGSLLEIYCAMEYAIEAKADVVSMSLGGLGISPLMSQAADDLAAADIPCVVSAGNETMDSVYSHPANTPSVFTISAVGQSFDENGGGPYYELADFSNFGSGIDFAAPGVDIESAAISGPENTTYKSGTSMATPYAAGCVADLLSYDKDMTNDEVYAYLKLGARDLGEAGFDDSFGWGMVNLTDVRPSGDFMMPAIPSLPSGTYDGAQDITFAADPDSAIYYTLDGTVPSPENGFAYTGVPLTVTDSCTLKTIAISGSKQSAVLSREYTITCTAPAISVESGAFSKAISVSLSTTSAGARIYYTTDGTDPSASNGTLYDGKALTISASAVLKAVAIVGNTLSEISREDYYINGTDIPGAFVVKNGVLTEYRGVSTTPDFSELSITAIGDGAFRGARRLMNVTLPETVTKIGSEAFADCIRLQTVRAPGVTTLGEGAFRRCNLMSSVSFGDVKQIPDSAFYECTYLSKVSGISSLESVGDYAFFSCRMLGSFDANWSGLRSIGEYAFAYTWMNGSISLDALETLGAYAFCNMDGLSGISLPSRITVLPEGVFREIGATVQTLSLPGVTEIGAYALSFRIYYAEPADLQLPYEQVTKIGEGAFADFTFQDSPVFSSVEQIGANAFSGATVKSISFPKLSVLTTGALSNIKAEIVYLEHAEKLETASVKYTGYMPSSMTLVFSDALTDIESGAVLNEEPNTPVISAPEGSAAEHYARQNGYTFIAAPGVVICGAESTPDGGYLMAAQQLVVTRVKAYPTVSGQEIAWYRCSNEYKGNAAAYSEGDELLLDTAEAGTYYYYAVSLENGEITAESQVMRVNVTPVEVLGTLTEKDTYTVVELTNQPDWSHMSSTVTVAYQIKVTEDDDYQLFVGDSMISDLVVADENGNTYNAYEVIEMHAGKTYIAVMTFNNPNLEPINVLYLHKFDDNFNGMYEVRAYTEESAYPLTGTSVEPPVIVTDTQYVYDEQTGTSYEESVNLTENEDYFLLYSNNTKNGTGKAYVIGKGNYCGMRIVTFRIFSDIKENQPVTGSLVSNSNPAYFKFTAPADGVFTFLTQYPESLIDAFCAGELDYIAFDTRITLYDSDWSEITYNDDIGSSLLAQIDAELTKGSVYYVELACWGDPADAVLNVTRRQTFGNLYIEPSNQRFAFTGEAVTPLPLIMDGDYTLTEGRDFTVRYAKNIMPGNISIIITGAGSYCGSLLDETSVIYIDESASSVQYIYPDAPFEMSEKIQAYSVYVSNGGTYSLLSADDAPFTCDILYYDSMWDVWAKIGRLSSDNTMIDLQPEQYYLILSQDSAQTRSFTLESTDVAPSLSLAYIELNDVYFTGEPAYPSVTVMMDGETLTEHVDYEIIYDDDMISCGTHELTVVGIGSYSGSQTAWFHILPKASSVQDEIGEGAHTASVTAPGETVFFSFVPDKEDYCIYSGDLRFKRISVFDDSLNELLFISSVGFSSSTVALTPGKTYLIAVSFADAGMTGDIAFTVTSDYVMMYECVVVSEDDSMVPYSPEGSISKYKLLHEDTELTEGVDYVVQSIGPTKEPGIVEVNLVGIGRYVGSLTYNYYIYPETFSAEDPIELFVDDTYSAQRGLPGKSFPFVFTAPEAGTYYCNLPGTLDNMSVFIYREDGSICPLNAKRFTLEAGEKLMILAITNWLEGSSDITDSFSLSVSTYIPPISYYENGVAYEIEDGVAYVSYFEPSLIGVMIPDYVYSAENDIGGTFGGFMGEALEAIQNGHTVYGENGGAVSEFCTQYGICFAGIDPQTTLAGDITGDGMIYIDDALTLIRWLGEGEGMQMSDQAYANADINGDGAVDLLDYRAILSYVSAHSVG